MNYDRCEDDGFIIRGKAISKLELMRCNSEWNEDFNKALDLAIKVLRQMGSEDLISRQQAIEAIEGVDWYHVNSKGELVHGSTSDEESWYKAEDIYKAIESLPPVTPTERKEPICEHYYKGYCSRFEDGCFWQCQTERTGEWIDTAEGTFCSECDYKTNEYHNFCPNCGADMRGDNK